MILGIPLAIWLGILTLILLLTTLSLGIALHFFRKNVFRYHMYFAFATGIMAVVHMVFAVALWFFGVQY